jgi:hypothetical protein
MSIASQTTRHTGARTSRGITRQEVLAAAGETLALFLIFIVSFTGRDAFGDSVKTLLTILTIVVGTLGSLAGLGILRRAFGSPDGRVARIVLSGWMLFAGIYSVVHVLS